MLEDEPLIALELDSVLTDAGYRIAGPASTCAAAMALARREHVDCALLDVMLPDGNCVELAGMLQAQGVPFAITTGLRAQDVEHPVLREARTLRKPFQAGVLLEAVQDLLAGTKPGPP